MSEIEKLFEDLQKTPNSQEQTFQKLSNLVKSGKLISEIQKILNSSLKNHESLKPFILIFLNDFVSSKNKNIKKNSDLLIYLNSIIEIILQKNLNFSLKSILGKSVTILANQLDKGNLDFIFSNFLNDFLNLKFSGDSLEGAIIVLTHFFKSFNIIGGDLNLKIIENIFSDNNFESFLGFLKKIFLENFYFDFEKYFFEDFIPVLIEYLHKVKFLGLVIGKSKFFFVLLEIMNDIPRENLIFKYYSLKLVLKIAKYLTNSKNCKKKHLFFEKFTNFLKTQITTYFKNEKNFSKAHKKKITKSLLLITQNENSKPFIRKNLEKILTKIIFPELITTKTEKNEALENPSEFIYYKFDCIDKRKSKTQKTYSFEILDNICDQNPGLFPFLIKSFIYLSNSLINNKKVNFEEFSFSGLDLKIFDFFGNKENFIESTFLVLSLLVYKIEDREDLVFFINGFICENFESFFCDFENRFFVLSSFFLFFAFSSDLILENSPIFEKILDFGFLFLENSENENVINLQIIFSFEKIVNEDRIFYYVKNKIEKINFLLLKKLEIFNFQEYFKFFKKIINCQEGNFNLDIVIAFIDKIILEIEQNNEFSICNLFQILSMYINRVDFKNLENDKIVLFDGKMKIIIEYLKKNKYLSISKEILIIFEKLVKKKICFNFSFLEFFLENISEIFKNIEDCKYLFFLILENFFKNHFEMVQKKRNFLNLLINTIFEEIDRNENMDKKNLIINFLIFNLLQEFKILENDQKTKILHFLLITLGKKNIDNDKEMLLGLNFVNICGIENLEFLIDFFQMRKIDTFDFLINSARFLLEVEECSNLIFSNLSKIFINYLNFLYKNNSEKFSNFFKLTILLLSLNEKKQFLKFAEKKTELKFFLKEEISAINKNELIKNIFNFEKNEEQNFSEISSLNSSEDGEDENIDDLEDQDLQKNITKIIFGNFSQKNINEILQKMITKFQKEFIDEYKIFFDLLNELKKNKNFEGFLQNLDFFYKEVILEISCLYYFFSEREKKWTIRKFFRIIK